jgi:DNA-directed RNA polymerase subunit beta'
LKENVIVGHLIPAGTGIRKYHKASVAPVEEYEKLDLPEEE